MILVEADISEEWDSSSGWEDLAGRAVRAAVRAAGHEALIESGFSLEVSVKLTNDAEVQALNAAYRGKDKPTNVLSFPMIDGQSIAALAQNKGEALLGDVVLAFETCAAEAGEKGVGIADHAAHLIVHGTLHLLGHDHEHDEAEADAMEGLERAALAGIGIADPYLAEMRN